MNVKSQITAINRHLERVFNMFGGQSDEYMKALKQVRDNIPDNVLQQTHTRGVNYAYDIPTEPLKISVGKSAQTILSNFENDIKQIRSEQKQTGTALEQAQKYIVELKKEGKQFSIANIKKTASGIYYFRNNVNDWYKAIDKSNLSETEKSVLKESYSELNGSDPIEYARLRKKIQADYNRVKDRLKPMKDNVIEELPSNIKEVDPNTIT